MHILIYILFYLDHNIKLYFTNKHDENSNIKTKLGPFEYYAMDNKISDDPVTVLKYSYNDLHVGKYYYGRLVTVLYTYFYIGFKLAESFSSFFIIGYDKYFHIARLFDNAWSDDTIL